MSVYYDPPITSDKVSVFLLFQNVAGVSVIARNASASTVSNSALYDTSFFPKIIHSCCGEFRYTYNGIHCSLNE